MYLYTLGVYQIQNILPLYLDQKKTTFIKKYDATYDYDSLLWRSAFP